MLLWVYFWEGLLRKSFTCAKPQKQNDQSTAGADDQICHGIVKTDIHSFYGTALPENGRLDGSVLLHIRTKKAVKSKFYDFPKGVEHHRKGKRAERSISLPEKSTAAKAKKRSRQKVQLIVLHGNFIV